MTSPTRRAVLRGSGAAALAALAGCSGSPSEDGTPGVPTDTGTDGGGGSTGGDEEFTLNTATRTPPEVDTPPSGECEATAPPMPSTGAGLPDPREYPNRPDEGTLEAVYEFLKAYETAYVYNRTLAEVAASGDCLEDLGVEVTSLSVESRRNGFLATVETFGHFTGTNCPGVSGTDTPTPLPHADFPGSARYYLTERFLVREGAVVACW